MVKTIDKKYIDFILLLLVLMMVKAVGSYEKAPAYNNTPYNFSEDYAGAVKYIVTAAEMDIASVDSYPQKVTKVFSHKPRYQVSVLVKNQSYFSLPSIPYERYEYDEVISQYLEPTELIESEDLLVTQLAAEFTKGQTSMMGIVSNALSWNTQNISYDNEIDDDIFYGNTPPQSAKTTIARGKGYCTDYANTFIATMRALGIPARYVVGVAQLHRELYGKDTQLFYYAWAEFYLKGYGWIPVDTQQGKVGIPNYYIKLFAGKDHFDCKGLSKLCNINAEMVPVLR